MRDEEAEVMGKQKLRLRTGPGTKMDVSTKRSERAQRSWSQDFLTSKQIPFPALEVLFQDYL